MRSILRRWWFILLKKKKDLSIRLSSAKPNLKKIKQLQVELKEMTTSVEKKKRNMARRLANDKSNMGRVRALRAFAEKSMRQC